MENFKISEYPSEKLRELDLIGSYSNASDKFPSNKISTSRFTSRTIFAKSIFEQFQNISNAWFLFIVIISFIYSDESYWNQLSRLVPLLCILFLTLFNDISSFIKQQKADQLLNLEKYLVWNGQDFEEKFSKDIFVGDIVLVFDDKPVPADLLLLSNNIQKECFADSYSVLGERNLQVKKPVKVTQLSLTGEDLNDVISNLKRINGQISVMNKSKSQDFKGKLKLKGFPKATRLTYENLVLKGTKIKNIHWMIGYVLYTGHETYIWAGAKKRKESISDKKIESWNTWVLVFTVIVVFIGFIVGQTRFQHPDSGKNFAGLLKQGQNMIPISFYFVICVVRIVKSYQVKFQNLAVSINNAKLLQDLGNIDYILVNKTGTLTENQLIAQVCVVGDKVYWKTPPPAEDILEIKYNINDLNNPDSEHLSFSDLSEQVKIRGSYSFHFLLCMTLCNKTSTKGNSGEYFSLSEDDKVLVETSSLLGMKLKSKSSGNSILYFEGEEIEYTLVAHQAYLPTQKKTRVLVKEPNKSSAYYYVKGNKEEMLDILSLSTEEKTSIEEFTLTKQLIKMKIIIMGFKKLNQQELENFEFSYQTAISSPVNSMGRIEDLFETLEKGVKFLGIVAIEDTIKASTACSLSLLTQAGIKSWIISGDGEESTLISGVGSKLFEENVRMVRLCNLTNEAESIKVMTQQIKEHIKHDHLKISEPSNSFLQVSEEDEGHNQYKMRSEPLIFAGSNLFPPTERGFLNLSTGIKDSQVFNRSQSLSNMNFNPSSVYFVLSVDKSGLDFGTASEESRKLFISLLFAAHSVCFHSLQAEDKIKVVKLLKNNFSFKPVVLAISDSQCDAGMIQEAQIGISLEKGYSQLRTISDFCLKSFDDLLALVLFEGHWSYMNLSGILSYSVYSSSLFFCVFFMFNFVSEFSGSVLVNDELLVIYSLVLPVIQMVFLGIYDKDLELKELRAYPQVYSLGVYKEIITFKKLGFQVAEGIVHGVVVSVFFYLSCFNAVGSTGAEFGLENIGFAFMLSLFVINSLKMVNETHLVSAKTLTGHAVSILIVLIHVFAVSYTNTSWSGFAENLVCMPSLMITAFIAPVLVYFLQTSVKFSRSLFWPSILDYVKRLRLMRVTFNLITRLELYKNHLFTVYKKSNNWNNKNDIESLNFSKITLRFLSGDKENDYNWNKIMINIRTYRSLLMFSLACLLVLTVCISVIQPIVSSINYWILPVLLVFFCVLIKYSFNRKIYRTFRVFLSIYYLSILVFLLIAGQVFYFHYIEANAILIPIFLIAFNSDWFFMCSISLLSLSTTIYDSISYYTSTEFSPEQIIVFLIFYLTLLLNSAAVGYTIDRTKRQEFILIQNVESKVDKSKNILSYLLPAFVRKRVKDGVKYISDDQGNVSVFFCDLMDFEDIVASFSPLELTAFLDDVFGKFDNLCRAVGVTKIETVGKTYMACAGLKDSEEELDPYYSAVSHARRAIELGLGIIRIANGIKVRGASLSVKIGINSGTVTAGVIGYHKPQFSLVGDTVNTASRMASTCPSPNSIQISKSTYEILDNKKGLVFNPRSVEVKGKGQMETFMVRLPVGALEISLHDNLQSLPSKVNNSPRELNGRTTTFYQRTSFVETATIQERRISTLLTHLEVSDPLQLFMRKDTEVIERVKLISFNCTENMKERKFRLETVQNNKPLIVFSMASIIICNIIVCIVYYISYSQSRLSVKFYLIKLLLEIISEIILLLCLKWYLTKLWFAWALQLVYVLSTIFDIIIFIYEPINESILFLTYLNHVLLFSHCAELFFKNNFWSIISLTVLRLVIILTKDQISFIIPSIYTVISTSTLIFTSFTIEKMLRVNSTLRAAANKELDKTEKLIKKMMPPHVLQKMKEEKGFTDKIQQITILYADIVGFTAWSSARLPEEVVGMLSELFTSFDKNCVKHNVYKVHTIGDCYVAMGFTGEENRDPVQECINIIEFAQQTIDIINAVNSENGINLNMRIGIHTGDITAGVTGTNIVRYDIYGSDVMIANKIESAGVAGKIAISEATKKLVEDRSDIFLSFIPHVDVYVKSTKKRIHTFLIE